MKKHSLLILGLILSGFPSHAIYAQETKLQIHDLKCEYAANLLAVESVAPRLSWQLSSPVRGSAQTAWRILVAFSSKTLARDEGDLWDSDKVDTPVTTPIAYSGRTLASRDRCFLRWLLPASWSSCCSDLS